MELSKIKFRNFTIEDYDLLIKIWTDSGLSIKNKGRDSKEKIKAEIKKGIADFIFAEDENKVVGVILATHDGRKGWINRLTVIPEFRGKGITRALVAEAENRLFEKGIEIYACLIEDDNKASLEVFEKLDYNEFPDMHYLTKRKYPEV